MPYKNKEKAKEYDRKWHRLKYIQNKKKALALFGSRCKCGIDDYRVLVFDHIVQIRRKGKERAGAELIRAILNGTEDKSNIRVLCANCHAIKTLKDYLLLV